MKKIVPKAVFAALVLMFFVAGCTKRKASDVDTGIVSVPETATQIEEITESESVEPEEYMSLIEKYVGKPGTPYKAYDTILKFGIENSMYPVEAWVDANGRLSLPFAPEDVMNDGTTSYACFYVPDELAAAASTSELVDICLTYYNSPMGMISLPQIHSLDFEFEWWLSHSNSMEESLRRDDFAVEYFERYMAEPIPEGDESMDQDEISAVYNLSCMLDIIEVVLSQPEAYEQLTEEQRVMLVERVMEKAVMVDEGKLFFDFTTSVEYPYFFVCITEKNIWYDAINEMDWTEYERGIINKYFADVW